MREFKLFHMCLGGKILSKIASSLVVLNGDPTHQPYVECSLNISSRIHFLRVLQCFLGCWFLDVASLAIISKKDLT